MPFDLLQAIEHANRVLDWTENLSSDELPPPWMWPFDDELALWFEEVERKREEKFGGSPDEESSMERNELAEGRGR